MQVSTVMQLRAALRNVNGRYRVNVGVARINGPFERELHDVYQSLCDYFSCGVNEYGLPVKCFPLDLLWKHFQDICSSQPQFERALMRIKWASFEPAEEMVCFYVNKSNHRDLRDTAVIDEKDLDLIESLIGLLKNPVNPWLEGCPINLLLEHCHTLMPFQGHIREGEFLEWVTKYPAFFNIEQYGISTAVKWTGCDLLFECWR